MDVTITSRTQISEIHTRLSVSFSRYTKLIVTSCRPEIFRYIVSHRKLIPHQWVASLSFSVTSSCLVCYYNSYRYIGYFKLCDLGLGVWEISTLTHVGHLWDFQGHCSSNLLANAAKKPQNCNNADEMEVWNSTINVMWKSKWSHSDNK